MFEVYEQFLLISPPLNFLELIYSKAIQCHNTAIFNRITVINFHSNLNFQFIQIIPLLMPIHYLIVLLNLEFSILFCVTRKIIYFRNHQADQTFANNSTAKGVCSSSILKLNFPIYFLYIISMLKLVKL